jgi:hypothetical protein
VAEEEAEVVEEKEEVTEEASKATIELQVLEAGCTVYQHFRGTRTLG